MDYVLFGTYEDLETARQVVSDLVENEFQRGDIGLAEKDNSTQVVRDPLLTADMEAIVTVTVGENQTNTALKVMRQYGPITLDVRDVQWKMKGWEHIPPSAEEFTAVKREEREEEQQRR